jgi:hypothetical protein
MYIATMQAAELIHQNMLEAKIYHVDKVAQKKLLEEWLKQKRDDHGSVQLTESEINSIVQFSSLEDGADAPSVWK